MRISPVTGDLAAVVGIPPVRPVADTPSRAEPVVGAAAQVTGTDPQATSDRRRTPALPAFFDPPLIAQRAALGLPVGFLVADLARTEGISYAAASAAVDREMPDEQD